MALLIDGHLAHDFCRIEGGKIAEHWDVVRPIPAMATDPDAMF